MKLIGDPHIGREFRANVPLDRRGERETMMLDQFWKELFEPMDDLIVIVGDLFDHWFIKYEYLYATIHTMINWAEQFPKKLLIIMGGNHDYSPDNTIVGAFDVLEAALLPYKNIRVVRRSQTLSGVMFFPWEWDRTALQQLDDMHDWTDTAVGHWDLVDYGGNTDHMCPAKELHDGGVVNIHSGHWHLPGIYDVCGIDVHCTGSMQPMTHAEDPNGSMYVTLTEEEYLRTDPHSLLDKYVRVILGSESEVVPPPSCLGFKVQKRVSEKEAEERVSLEGFDMKKILRDTLTKYEVPEPVQTRIVGRLNDIA